MKFFDAGQHAEGFIAIGQEAVGVFAFGQLALGVVAVGQLARGVVAVGQLACGVFTVCQVGFGVHTCASTGGLAGRIALGLVVAMLPKRKVDKADLPEVTPIARLLDGRAPTGWIEARLSSDGLGELCAQHERRDLGEAIDLAEVSEAGQRLASSDWNVALVHVRGEERLVDNAQVGYRAAAPRRRVLVATDLREVPRPLRRSLGRLALGVAGVLVLTAAFVGIVALPLWEALSAMSVPTKH